MASSLFDMAVRACIRNVLDMYDVGELRYETIRPVLKHVSNPAQLREIEQASPHIAEDDGELWQNFIRRDISNGQKKLQVNQPRNPASWWKVYRKLKREDEAERQAAEDRLKAALNTHKVGKDAKQTTIVRAVIPSGEKRSTWGTTQRDKPSGDRALKNAKTIGDQMAILKRQTAQAPRGRTVAQSIPMHQLQSLKGKVTQAPASMVHQYTAHRPAASRPPPAAVQTQAYRPIFAAKPLTQADRALATALKQEQADKERRLRQLTGASAPKSTSAAPPSASASAQPRPSSTATLARKRPAYDPFLPAKRRRP